MVDTAYKRSLLRSGRSHQEARVGFVELFFDLVFVFAVTQLSHGLIHHFTVGGALETAFLTLAVWWVWIYTTWVMNWLNPQTNEVRALLFVLMFAGLMLASAIPSAFSDKALVFACAYAFMQVGRSTFTCWVLRGVDDGTYVNFLRITIWLAVAGVFWLAGALVARPMTDGVSLWVMWSIALGIELLGPWVGFWTPGIGRSTTADWDVSGVHMAERCGLFMIIALGESLLVSGATFAELEWTLPVIVGLINAFTSTAAIWWVYFNVSAERASDRIYESDDPGRLARLAYTYLHVPIVAGVILVAVSDEFVLGHPIGHVEPLVVVAIVGGPALFLLGCLLFKWAIFGRLQLSHMAGIVSLLVLSAFSLSLPALVLGAFGSLILVIVGAWEHLSVGHEVSSNPS